MVNCFYDCYTILNKVYSDGAYLKQAISSSFIEEKNRALTVKTCYGVLDRDLELSYYISALADKSPKLAVRTVLKIAMYHIKYLGKHTYAVTDNAVTLVKKLGKGGVGGFVNAFLRKFAANTPVLPDTLSLKYSYPQFAVDKLVKEYGRERAEAIMSASGGDTTLVFLGGGAEYLKDYDFKKTPFKGVYIVKNFTRNADYDKGVYTFQSIGSVAICEVVEGGGCLFDACAAPGGKSVYLSRRFDRVVSEELHAHRAELIKDYASRMKIDNIEVVCGDASLYNESYAAAFDAVLCDVPCSGFGVAFENPDIKLNKNENTLKELCALQKRIISNCAKYVKKGGALYYSTCSYFGEENDGVIKDFLKSNADFKLKEISSPLPHLKTQCGLQFLPDVSGGGFYVSASVRI